MIQENELISMSGAGWQDSVWVWILFGATVIWFGGFVFPTAYATVWRAFIELFLLRPALMLRNLPWWADFIFAYTALFGLIAMVVILLIKWTHQAYRWVAGLF